MVEFKVLRPSLAVWNRNRGRIRQNFWSYEGFRYGVFFDLVVARKKVVQFLRPEEKVAADKDANMEGVLLKLKVDMCIAKEGRAF